MENLCSLLFELANEDRLRILHELSKKSINITRLSKALDLVLQESSRHVSRLDTARLTRKKVDGSHDLTSYGRLVLKLLQGIEFTSRHRDYFVTHSTESLPEKFLCRIGELSNGKHTDDIQISFYNAERATKDAEKYILLITDRYLLNIAPLLTEAFERGVKVRKIEPKNWFLPAEVEETLIVENAEAKSRARATGLLEERLLGHVDIYLLMSEKEVAGIAFPTADGKLDYLGFSAKDERSHRLCKEIFRYYWKRAHSCASVAEDIYKWLKNRQDAISIIRNIAKGKEVIANRELMLELENAGLVRKNKLTMLGDIMYTKLQQNIQ